MIDALLAGARVLPTIAIDVTDDALPLAEVLQTAGITLMEITLRTPAGLPAIRALKRRADLHIGVAAGTLRTPDELREAADAGAELLVSPGHTLALIALAERLQLPWLPGCATPSEVLHLLAHGHHVQKLFPAQLSLLDALAGPFVDVRFVPTSGVNQDNAAQWLARPNVIAIAGTWIAPRQLIAERNWNEIGRRARAALNTANQATAH